MLKQKTPDVFNSNNKCRRPWPPLSLQKKFYLLAAVGGGRHCRFGGAHGFPVCYTGSEIAPCRLLLDRNYDRLSEIMRASRANGLVTTGNGQRFCAPAELHLKIRNLN